MTAKASGRIASPGNSGWCKTRKVISRLNYLQKSQRTLYLTISFLTELCLDSCLLHGNTFQMMVLFTVTALKTFNFIKKLVFSKKELKAKGVGKGTK
jgi:hypothetical protein